MQLRGEFIFMKSKGLKVIFVLTFIPYLAIISSLIFGSYTLNGVELQGMERVVKVLSSCLYTMFIWRPIGLACFTFQLCYIFRKKPVVMFLCSFIPYVVGICFAIYSAMVGISFLSDELSYGLEGFFVGLIGVWVYFVLNFPLLPLCFVFQVACVIVFLVRRSKKNKAVAKQD